MVMSKDKAVQVMGQMREVSNKAEKRVDEVIQQMEKISERESKLHKLKEQCKEAVKQWSEAMVARVEAHSKAVCVQVDQMCSERILKLQRVHKQLQVECEDVGSGVEFIQHYALTPPPPLQVVLEQSSQTATAEAIAAVVALMRVKDVVFRRMETVMRMGEQKAEEEEDVQAIIDDEEMWRKLTEAKRSATDQCAMEWLENGMKLTTQSIISTLQCLLQNVCVAFSFININLSLCFVE